MKAKDPSELDRLRARIDDALRRERPRCRDHAAARAPARTGARSRRALRVRSPPHRRASAAERALARGSASAARDQDGRRRRHHARADGAVPGAARQLRLGRVPLRARARARPEQRLVPPQPRPPARRRAQHAAGRARCTCAGPTRRIPWRTKSRPRSRTVWRGSASSKKRKPWRARRSTSRPNHESHASLVAWIRRGAPGGYLFSADQAFARARPASRRPKTKRVRNEPRATATCCAPSLAGLQSSGAPDVLKSRAEHVWRDYRVAAAQRARRQARGARGGSRVRGVHHARHHRASRSPASPSATASRRPRWRAATRTSARTLALRGRRPALPALSAPRSSRISLRGARSSDLPAQKRVARTSRVSPWAWTHCARRCRCARLLLALAETRAGRGLVRLRSGSRTRRLRASQTAPSLSIEGVDSEPLGDALLRRGRARRRRSRRMRSRSAAARGGLVGQWLVEVGAATAPAVEHGAARAAGRARRSAAAPGSSRASS